MAEIPVNLCFFGWIIWWQIWQRTCCFEVRMHCLCVQDMINASTAKTSSKWHKMTYRRPTNNTSDLALSACVIHELRWGDKVEGSARGVGNFKGYLFQGRHVQHLLYQKKKFHWTLSSLTHVCCNLPDMMQQYFTFLRVLKYCKEGDLSAPSLNQHLPCGVLKPQGRLLHCQQ